MSRMMLSGGLLSCTRSTQAPNRSASVSRLGVGCQPLGLEAPHLTAGSCRTIEPLTADDGPHGGVAGESLGVVHVLVAGEPTEHRLAEQPAQRVTRVLTAAPIEELGDRDICEPNASSSSR